MPVIPVALLLHNLNQTVWLCHILCIKM